MPAQSVSVSHFGPLITDHAISITLGHTSAATSGAPKVNARQPNTTGLDRLDDLRGGCSRVALMVFVVGIGMAASRSVPSRRAGQPIRHRQATHADPRQSAKSME